MVQRFRVQWFRVQGSEVWGYALRAVAPQAGFRVFVKINT